MNKELKKKIFVIYSTRDPYINKKSLSNIYNDLQNYGNVFIDLLHNTSVNKQEYVLKKLNESSHIVIIDSPRITESKWAQLEIKIAKEQNKQIFGYYEVKFVDNKVLLEFKKQ